MTRIGKGHCYVSKYGEGFTTIPELAATVKVDGQDLPVLAPGVTFSIRNQNMTRQVLCWDVLLDAMEEDLIIDEKIEACDNPKQMKRLRRDKFANESFMRGAIDVLAVQGYGKADDPAREGIKAQAKIRYNQES